MAAELGNTACAAETYSPQTMRLIVAQSATADLPRLYAFLADKNPGAADRVAAARIEAIQSLDIFPQRGRPSGRRMSAN